MTNRLIWADALKGILILLVIIGHCIANVIGNDAANKNYLWCLIYSFHMPTFFAISGFLSYRKDYTLYSNCNNVIIRRFLQLMVPFFMWSIIFYFVKECSLRSFYNCIVMPHETFWFLWALFFIVTIFNISNLISNKILFLRQRNEVLLSIICLICGGCLIIIPDIRIFGVQYILYYFIFYYLGFAIHKFKITTSNRYIIIILVILWLILGSFWQPHKLPSAIISITGDASYIKYIYKFIVAFIAILALFSLAPIILNRSHKLNRFFCTCGTISLGIYVCHMTFISKLTHYLSGIIIDKPWIMICLLFILTSIISFSIVIFIEKWKWSARFLLGKF